MHGNTTASPSPEGKKSAGTAPLYVAIAIFGFVGAAVRYAVGELPIDSWLPVNTLIINIFGCYVISIIYLYLGRRMHLTAEVVKGMSVGLVGAFTTLSAFYVEEIYFLADGRFDYAIIYFIITAVASFIASLLGMRTSNVLALGRMKRLQWKRMRQHEKTAKMRAREIGSYMVRVEQPPVESDQAAEAVGEDAEPPEEGGGR